MRLEFERMSRLTGAILVEAQKASLTVVILPQDVGPYTLIRSLKISCQDVNFHKNLGMICISQISGFIQDFTSIAAMFMFYLIGVTTIFDNRLARSRVHIEVCILTDRHPRLMISSHFRIRQAHPRASDLLRSF